MLSNTPTPALRPAWLLRALIGLSLAWFGTGAWAMAAGAGTHSVCDRAAVRAANQHGVPLDILRAITRVETGRAEGARGVQPWPWTVNMEGKGKWFQTRDEALSYVFKHFKRGARSFDVGCFQINFNGTGRHFLRSKRCLSLMQMPTMPPGS